MTVKQWKELKEEVIEYKQRNELSYRMLGKIMGVNYSTLFNLMTETQTLPSITTFEKIQAFITSYKNTPVRELYFYEKNSEHMTVLNYLLYTASFKCNTCDCSDRKSCEFCALIALAVGEYKDRIALRQKDKQ